jgi:hypothetical protein
MRPAKSAAEIAELKKMTVTIEGITFDYRVLKHYTAERLKLMSPAKRRQIDFIYTKSYKIVESSCEKFNEREIDVAELAIYRKTDEDVTMKVGAACAVHIQLLSENSLQQHLKLLEN